MGPLTLVLRALFGFVAFVVLTILGSLGALVLGLLDRTGDLVLALARVWARGILSSAGVQVRVRSHATLDPKRPYVVMPNHLSTVDIWAIFVAVPVPLRFIAKKQLGRIPLFGWAMRAGRFIFIDRQNASAARRTIDAAAERVRNGCSVVIFPEGTRSLDGHLGAFKKGGFHLAINAGAAVVPIARGHAERGVPHPPGHRRHRDRGADPDDRPRPRPERPAGPARVDARAPRGHARPDRCARRRRRRRRRAVVFAG
jgi:1-acyl-sn-glycerol-3-phosphate acyltransferase